MGTLKKQAEITGHGLMKNKPCKVTFFPSNEGKIRYFVKGEEAFTADIDNLISTDHCVTLGNKKSRVMLEEHLSAAMAFCGIDSVDICMDESEVPALDGSAKGWVELFKQTGIEKTKPKYYTVSEPIYCGAGIKCPDDARKVKEAGGDGFFVGSSIIKLYDEPDKLVALIREYKEITKD